MVGEYILYIGCLLYISAKMRRKTLIKGEGTLLKMNKRAGAAVLGVGSSSRRTKQLRIVRGSRRQAAEKGKKG